MERGVQEVARSITREDATRPVSAMGGRCQTKDEHPRFGVAETGQGSTPVGLVGEARDLLRRHPLSPGDKARAKAANDDVASQLGEGRTGRQPDRTRLSRRDARLLKVVDLHRRSDLANRFGSLASRPRSRRIATRPRRSRGSPPAGHADVAESGRGRHSGQRPSRRLTSTSPTRPATYRAFRSATSSASGLNASW